MIRTDNDVKVIVHSCFDEQEISEILTKFYNKEGELCIGDVIFIANNKWTVSADPVYKISDEGSVSIVYIQLALVR